MIFTLIESTFSIYSNATFWQVGAIRMGKLNVFKQSLNPALDRNYFLDHLISDHSLLTILTQNYLLYFIN